MMSTHDSDARRHAFIAEIRAVPAGQVASYGAIARRAGYPRNARWVARLLAEGGEADLPWHRIVRSDGRIAFPAGSAAFDEQCARLRSEGVDVIGGRVRLHSGAGEQWLDAALWSKALPDDN
ncbi:MGMT family protein [Xanthomonadaceae bacterium XH05]|nr:MGMT family protein [Xanthomonadaceae bacterium XH05]